MFGDAVEEMVFEFAYVADIFDPGERAVFGGCGCASGRQDLVDGLGLDLDVEIGVGGEVEGVVMGGHIEG